MSVFAGADTGAKELEPVVPEIVVESTPDVQAVEAQIGIPQTIQRVESSPILESGDTTMGEAPWVTISDPGSRLPTFQARFNLLEFNSLPATFALLGTRTIVVPATLVAGPFLISHNFLLLVLLPQKSPADFPFWGVPKEMTFSPFSFKASHFF